MVNKRNTITFARYKCDNCEQIFTTSNGRVTAGLIEFTNCVCCGATKDHLDELEPAVIIANLKIRSVGAYTEPVEDDEVMV